MSMLPEAKLDILLAHHASLEAQLLGQVNSENYVRITRELAELNPLIDAVKAYRAANAELAGIDALIADPATETEMRGMAEAERETLAARSVELAQQIRVALLPKDAMDDRNVVLEIRAGTGGDEAALFAGDLFRMYERFASLQGWKVEVISASEGTMGGSTSRATICGSRPCARRAPAASMSTRPNPRSASPIFRPASSSACRTADPSTRTARRR